MDIILFILGIICLFRNRMSWVWTILVLLSTTFLHLKLGPESILKAHFFPHVVTDLGLYLFLLLFIKHFASNKVQWTGKVQKVVTIFLAFIVLNGIYDGFVCGTAWGDVIRYDREWMLLLIAYIYPYVKKEDVLKSVKQLYYITFFICVLLIIHKTVFYMDFLHYFVNFKDDSVRGVKAPGYSIYFAGMVAVNVWNFRTSKQILHLLVFSLPVLFNMKMTYCMSIFLIFILYYMISNKMNVGKRFFVIIAFLMSIGVYFVLDNQFAERFDSMTTEVESARNNERDGNFSYRLLHAGERLYYILQDPSRTIRGIGYVSEEHFKISPFYLGVYVESLGKTAQIDTGDIAWSLFFLRLGFLGILLYLLMVIKIAVEFWSNRNLQLFNYYFFCVIVVFVCFTSFGNAIIADGSFFIWPFLFLTPSLLHSNKKFKLSNRKSV